MVEGGKGRGGEGETSSFLVPSILQVLVSHVKLDFGPIKTFPIVPRESFYAVQPLDGRA